MASPSRDAAGSPADSVPAAALIPHTGWVAALALAAIAVHLVLRFGLRLEGVAWGLPVHELPLAIAIAFGGLPLVFALVRKLVRLELSSDLLAGISIVTSVALDELLAGTLVVLMLAGGQTLESFAVRRASSALEALARRMPSIAHRRKVDGAIEDVALDDLAPGDLVVVFPHDICPVDGTVAEGHGTMDESYLTGEPYQLSKAPGAAVLSGAVNGESALVVRASARAVDSRYARILAVMRESEQRRPKLRRLGDQLGAIYTPVAVAIAIGAWLASGEPLRFLAVLVVATPCPLLIGIPVAVLGSISLAARRGIIVRDPAALERIGTCRTAMFDKTGTLTYGEPRLTEIVARPGFEADEVLGLLASLERYSRHPLASAILAAAGKRSVALAPVERLSEAPGQGLTGAVGGREVRVTSRRGLAAVDPDGAAALPGQQPGLECAIAVDGRAAALFRFRDEPRADSVAFVGHLGRRHRIRRVMLVSGDRAAEVEDLAARVGIHEIHSGQTPEQKLALVRAETAKAPTVYLGDGINDAPALTAATVGVAFGRSSDVTGEAAGVVILDDSLARVDELLHIGLRMRRIALQSAVGGMLASLVGMGFAAVGLLTPVAGAIVQEVIDVLAVANALRVAVPPRSLSDYDDGGA